jgi:hypothetical protein
VGGRGGPFEGAVDRAALAAKPAIGLDFLGIVTAARKAIEDMIYQ